MSGDGHGDASDAAVPEDTSPGAVRDGLDPAAAQGVIAQHGFLSWLGVEITVLERGRAVMEVPYQDKLANWGNGTLHGGVTATCIDSCSAFALRTTFEEPLSLRMATTDLNVKYVRPAASDVRVEAEVVRAGTDTGMTQVTATGEAPDGERKTVATGSTTYRLFTGDGDGDGGGEES
jgi:uncharacterized protein (TIGR00369 family)